VKIFTAPDTEITYRAFSLAPGKYALSVALLVRFGLHPEGGSESAVAPGVWDIISPAVKGYAVFDEGWPKLRGEYLVFGAAYLRDAKAQQPLNAAVSVGALSKQLAVFGERFFTPGGGVTAPTPFVRMPIAPQTAYGGESCPLNPYGKAAIAVQNEAGQSIHPLPNVELPSALMHASRDTGYVAGFWPYYPDMPQRTQYLGLFDDEWVKTRWPHLPIKTDFTFFQAAPEDQRRASGYWQGNETVVVQNMHPEHALLKGTLPNCRARVFGAVLDVQGECHFGETQTRLESVFLMPDQRAGIALYRSVIEVDDPEGKDVVALYAELESLQSSPAVAKDYLWNFKTKLNEDPVDEKSSSAGLAPSADQENKTLTVLLAELDIQRQRFVQHMSQSGMTQAQILTALKSNPQTRELALLIEQSAGGVGVFFDRIEAFARSAVQAEPDGSDQTVAALSDAAGARLARQSVLQQQQAGADCRDLTLAYADLSGLDLSGMDFSGAVLIGANFVGSLLRGAMFDRAALTEANFSAADLSSASFVRASLSGAQFHGANLSKACLLSADCALASFGDAVLERLDMSGGNFAGAQLRNAILKGVSANKADFTGAHLAQADLTGAKLVEANFSGADLTGADLSHASCIGAFFSCAKLHKANFEGADLADSSADNGTQATAVNFTGACMTRACWIGANLSGSNFDNMSAQGANFSQTQMSMVTMRGVVAKQSSFDKAIVSDADFSKSNWMEASFAQAKLTNTCLNSCNFYGANFLDTVFLNVQLEDAYIARTILAARIGANNV
jgi:uncharacterized protein YjbI with pentapeptide repeats